MKHATGNFLYPPLRNATSRQFQHQNATSVFIKVGAKDCCCSTWRRWFGVKGKEKCQSVLNVLTSNFCLAHPVFHKWIFFTISKNYHFVFVNFYKPALFFGATSTVSFR